MYRLIVVDDEKAIRKGICSFINWNSMGFSVEADFEDGKETLSYIMEHPVDVILTDIEMAETSGLSLAQFVREKELPIKIVIVSGYKDFEYARKAIEYGVEHYLLKPIRIEEVTEVFKKIKARLDQEKQSSVEQMSGMEKYEELLPELREQFWVSLLAGGFRSREVIAKRMQLLKMDVVPDNPCAVLRVDLILAQDENHNSYYENEHYRHLMHNIFGHMGEDIFGAPIYVDENCTKIMAVANKSMTGVAFEQTLRDSIAEVCASAKNLLQLEFKVEVEKVFPAVAQIGQKRYEFFPSGRPEAARADIPISAEEYEYLLQKYKLLMGVINDGDFEELDGLMDTIFFEVRKLPLENVKQITIDVFSMLSNRFLKMGIDFWKEINQTVSYEHIMDASDIKELKDVSMKMLYNSIEIVNSKQNLSSKNFIEQSIVYMKKHYNEDISLERVADRLFLNQTYFSRLFKQYIGNTFTDYLIELRMEKAKELLETGKYKAYEVSQLVGYRSEKYFFRIFKQYTGSSPAEYYRGKKYNENQQ